MIGNGESAESMEMLNSPAEQWSVVFLNYFHRMEEHYDVEMKSDRESTICTMFMLVCRVRIHNAIHSDSEVKRKFQASPV